jgi:hypothetical protein
VENTPYFDMGIPGGGQGSVHYFVLNSLLRSRIDCGFESNTVHYDEDVNVYLVHLLTELVRSPGAPLPADPRDIDVFHRVRDSQNPRFKGEVYRSSADQLLISTGIFTETPYIAREGRRVFDSSAQTRIGRGKAYYHFASMFHGQARSGSSALSRILDRLSTDFERYVEVLFHMRGEYMNLYEQLRTEAIASLQDSAASSLDEADQRSELERLRDDFLDAYWAWHQRPSEAHRAAVLEAGERLRAYDPLFHFEIPEN